MLGRCNKSVTNETGFYQLDWRLHVSAVSASHHEAFYRR